MSTIRKLLMTNSFGYLALAMKAIADDEGEPMGIIELDDSLADVEKPPELPAGVYSGEVQDVQQQDSQKGNRYFAIKFVIPPEEIRADIRDHFPDGAILYWNRQTVPKKGDRRALFNLRKLIEALGLDSNTTTIDPNEWMGCTAKLRIRQKPWEGEMRSEIAAVEAAEKAASTAGRGGRKKQEVEDDDGEEDDRRPSKKPAARGRR